MTEPTFTGGTWLAQETVTFAGQVMEGGVLSNTVITWVQVAVFPQTSVARYVRVRVNLFTHVWLVMASPRWVTATAPAQLSEAVTEPVLTGGTWLAQETVTPAGHVIEGGVSSNTTITWAQVDELPHSSVAT